jgi:hypothetical protein
MRPAFLLMVLTRLLMLMRLLLMALTQVLIPGWSGRGDRAPPGA